MQHALPLLAQWDAFVPDTDRVTRSAAPPSSSRPCCWMTWMNSSMNKMVVPTYLHVPICCFLLCCFPRCRRSFLVVVQFSHFSCSHIFPIYPFWFSMLHMSFLFGGYTISPFFLHPHFLHFPVLVFNVLFSFL